MRRPAVESQGRWQRAQRAELRWWKKYLSRKDMADYREWKIAYWNDLLSRLPDGVLPAEGSHVLEAGCGPAGIFMALDKYKVTATDPLVEQYGSAGLLAKEDYPWVRFERVGLEDMVIQNLPTYAAVFCLNVLNHVNDMNVCLRNLHAMTAIGGHLVMTIDVHRLRLLRNLLRLIRVDRLHPHQHVLQEYTLMLRQSGFGIIRTWPIWKRGLLAHWLIVAERAD